MAFLRSLAPQFGSIIWDTANQAELALAILLRRRYAIGKAKIDQERIKGIGFLDGNVSSPSIGRLIHGVFSYELSKENSHRSLIDEFKYSGDPKLSIIGNYLERLRDRRNKADYDDIVLNLRKNAEQAAKFFQIVIDRLDAD